MVNYKKFCGTRYWRSGVGSGDHGKRLGSDHEVLHMLLSLQYQLPVHKELIKEASTRIMIRFVLTLVAM